MRKKLKYILFLIVTVIMCSSMKVNAETYSEKFNSRYMWIPHTFVKKVKDGVGMYQQLTMIVRKSDNQIVYCLESHVGLDNDLLYTGYDYDQATFAKMTLEQWQRIQLLSYYGYGYSDSEVDHSDVKWYSVTQMMIWQTVPHGYDIYFTKTLNGEKSSDFDDEMQEMEKLVSNHSVRPKFNQNTYEMVIGNTLKLTDTSGVLSKYEVSSNSKVTTRKDGNDLYITAKDIGNINLTLTKKDVKYSHPPIVYVDPESQDVMEAGSYDPISSNISINIVGGKVSINKVDSDTDSSKAQGDATLKGAVYGIYKEDGTYLTEITTDENGYAQSDYLSSIGRFYLQEITASKGYELDTNKYYFDLSTENLNVTVKVKEKVIKRKYEITKVFASNKTQVVTPEPNVEFGIYDKSNNLVLKATTDSDGKFSFTLPYGKYTLRQLTTTVGYEKMKDFEFEITKSGSTIYKVFSNAEITSRVKVIKVDQDGNSINMAGIKFKIKDLSTDEYVCQRISYPTAKTYCEFETDDNGILITPYPLNSGNYQLEEIDQVIDGYLWNSEPLKFSINGNSNIIESDEFDAIIELKFTNTEVKGAVEIQKTGEKVVIQDGNFNYTEKPLPNIKFGLYDKDGILIKEVQTDENGYVKIEDLKLGKYILKELETLDGYVLDTKEYEFELIYKDQYTPIILKSFTLKNYLSKGNLEFSKTDISTGVGIKDTKVEIYTDNDELVFSGITDENGNIKIDNLFLGKFYIIETEASTGYRLSDEKVYFEIKENGEIVKANMTNERIKSKVGLHKVDSNNNSLEGVIIGVYNLDGNLLGSYVTDENGNIEVELEYGSYYFQEIETIDGYKLSDEKVYFDITEDGEFIQKTLINELEEIEVPDTLENKIPIAEIISCSFLVLGIGVIIYAKKWKNK